MSAKIATIAVALFAAKAYAQVDPHVSETMTAGSVDQYRCKDSDDCFGKNCKSFTYSTDECIKTQEGHWAKLSCDRATNEVTFEEYDTEGCAEEPRDTITYYLDECLIVGSGSLHFENCQSAGV